MLGRTNFTAAEIEHAKTTIDAQLKAYRAVADAAEINPNDEDLNAAVDDFNSVFFNNLALALDRFFVHRVRAVTGTDGNPLNELELICQSLMTNNGVFDTGTVIKYSQGASIVKLAPGDTIHLSVDDFTRLSAAAFIELDEKFGEKTSVDD
ncbi:hypothetical protein [Spelaeicoccus albus]|uniref:Uncharacterized protein n=1 Tax=Spelaeicoccus albus TaxID=1280376 RepID=A0A7Z0D271_9MICO|nr:hypothetical protein [Spelaeicoccus albus]NYI67513.1 hypothetical protein [Spelaeicoccus albus]